MINEALLIGNVGKKNSKNVKNNSEMVVVSLVTTRKFKDASGVYKEFKTWHYVNFYDKLAEIASKYINVGDLILVKGLINNTKLSDGNYFYSVTAREVKFFPLCKKRTDFEEKEQGDISIPEDDIPF